MMVNEISQDLLLTVAAQVLIHFWWQAVLIALFTISVLKIGRFRSPFLRYYVTLAGFSLLIALPIATATFVAGNYEPIIQESSSGESSLATPGYPATFAGIPGTANLDQIQPDKPTMLATINSVINKNRSLVLLLWLSGLALMLIRMSISWLWCWRLKKCFVPVPKPMSRRFERIKRQIGCAKSIAIGTVGNLQQAIAIGLFKPMVLIPASWLTEIPVKSLEAIVAHELAHIKRLDLWVNMLQRFVESLFFYHPAVWWLSRRIRIEREMCCDKIASDTIMDPVVYAKTLSQVATIQYKSNPSLNFGASFLGGPRMLLLARIKNVLAPDTRPQLGVGVATFSMILLLALPIVAWAAVSTRSVQVDETGKKQADSDDTRSILAALHWLGAQDENNQGSDSVTADGNEANRGRIIALLRDITPILVTSQDESKKEIGEINQSQLAELRALAIALKQLKNQTEQTEQRQRQVEDILAAIEKIQSTRRSKAETQSQLRQLDLAVQDQNEKKDRSQQEAESRRIADLKAMLALKQAQIEQLQAQLAHAQSSFAKGTADQTAQMLKEQQKQVEYEWRLLDNQKHLEQRLQETFQKEQLKQIEDLYRQQMKSDLPEKLKIEIDNKIKAIKDKQRQEKSDRHQKDKSADDKNKSKSKATEADSRRQEEIKQAKERSAQTRVMLDVQAAKLKEQEQAFHQAQKYLADLSQKYSDSHPEVAKQQDRIEQMKEHLSRLNVEKHQVAALFEAQRVKEKAMQQKQEELNQLSNKMLKKDFTEQQLKSMLENRQKAIYEAELAHRYHELKSGKELVPQSCSACHSGPTSYKWIDSNQCPTIQGMKQMSDESQNAKRDDELRQTIQQLNERVAELKKEVERLQKDRSVDNAGQDKDLPPSDKLLLKKFYELQQKQNAEELKKQAGTGEAGNGVYSFEWVPLIVPGRQGQYELQLMRQKESKDKNKDDNSDSNDKKTFDPMQQPGKNIAHNRALFTAFFAKTMGIDFTQSQQHKVK